MGRGLREVAADVVCTLGMEEDEGKIDALAASLAEAANKTFGSNNDLPRHRGLASSQHDE